MNKILDYWDVRLANWALWFVSGVSMGQSAYDEKNDWNVTPPPPPPLVGEALDTDRLVRKLGEEQRLALEVAYVWTGTLLDRCAQAHIHRDTLADRVKAAKFKLDDLDRECRNATREALKLVTA
jgi:hypothetical protein